MQFPLRKLAAIDIGSNAVRCQISAVLYYEGRYRLKRVEYVRFPMRLGEDVFATGSISPAKEEQFVKFLHSLRLLMEVHGVAHYLVCATSAMRSAANGAEIVERVREQLGMEIKVIDGQDEAYYINRVIEHVLEDKRHYLHIDVGGGSTEFNIYHHRHKVAAQSFEIGSIRRMQQEESGEASTEAQAELWARMEAWVRTNAREYHVTRAIGRLPRQSRNPPQLGNNPEPPGWPKHERAGERGDAEPRPRRRNRARWPYLPVGHGMGQRKQHGGARHRPERRHAASLVRRIL
jgi:exopolyphosphatase/guanosine-5'-triphosphate,3'-diphosphate pyrophosphatase